MSRPRGAEPPQVRTRAAPASQPPVRLRGSGVGFMLNAADGSVPHPAMGRSQAVRQRILIPPSGGSNPPAPATCFQYHFRLPAILLQVRLLPLFYSSVLQPVSGGLAGLLSQLPLATDQAVGLARSTACTDGVTGKIRWQWPGLCGINREVYLTSLYLSGVVPHCVGCVGGRCLGFGAPFSADLIV